jgi:uncharacterized protein (DUF488 family)
VKIFTIGFTKKSAEDFFTKLRSSGAKRLVDVRLNNVSQLAGFAKKSDLKFFLREIASMDYVHVPLLAPTQELLDRYKKNGGQWSDYERDFLELMKSRQIEVNVPKDVIAEACLLCSEERPEHCHRRLVADYLTERWGDVESVHLV